MLSRRRSLKITDVKHSQKLTAFTPLKRPFQTLPVESFGNSLADSVSFRVPSWQSLDGPPFLRQRQRSTSPPLGSSEAGYMVDFAVDLLISGLLIAALLCCKGKSQQTY